MNDEELHQLGVLKAAETIHMHHTGSAMDFDDDKLADIVSWLRCRVENWKPYLSKTEFFDNACKLVCIAAIAEYDRSR